MGVVSAVWVLAIHAVCVGFDPEDASRGADRARQGRVHARRIRNRLSDQPYDLQSHIDSSLTRLLAQVWPMALLGYFLTARTPREVRA